MKHMRNSVLFVCLTLQLAGIATAATQQADQKGAIISIEAAYNFRKIDDRISTSGLLSEEQLAALSLAGYEAVINLLPSNSQYAIKQEQDIVETQGVLYRHFPVDFSNPTESDYGAFEAVFEEFRDKKVLVHCAANFRASAFFPSTLTRTWDGLANRSTSLSRRFGTPGSARPGRRLLRTSLGLPGSNSHQADKCLSMRISHTSWTHKQ
ncbi:MAG: protein tyrosine phosphatase family protein [bacterium]|nr:hypothetical protein [Gammaproteobacteria bacterium]HIL98508.1 hypothetical protein [Pseudomonadales bacterium]